MLHCCWVYKPDVVYLYFTKKMLDTENKDHRYTWAINKPGEKIGHKFKIIKIERPNCTNPHIFDTFFDDFEDIFLKIEKEYPDAEIFGNASSGTPAMKNTIVIIAAMSDKNITVIQVSSGEKGSVERDDHNTYDVKEQWDCNLDNTEEFKDRTTLIHSHNFMVKVKKENIRRRYINAYDYSAAAMLAESIQGRISDEAFRHIILSADILKATDKERRILDCLNAKFDGKYRDREYTTARLEAVIDGMSSDEKLKKYAKTIRTAEKKIRNKAAHTIISIDDSFIKREIGISADELYDCMKKMAVKLGLVNKNVWKSYEKNE